MKVLFAGVLAATIMASTLVSGFVHLNVDHHMNLPKEVVAKQEVTTRQASDDPRFKTVVDIRLGAEIEGQDTLRQVMKALQEADDKTKIIMHINGVGGEVDTVMELADNVRSSKAYVVMSVESPSYSGHAYLATQGDELQMSPNSFLMFHTTSGYGFDCTKQKGKDRTVSNVEHCKAFQAAHLRLVNNFLDNISILTPAQKVAIKTGHDVYVFPEDVNKEVK